MISRKKKCWGNMTVTRLDAGLPLLLLLILLIANSIDPVAAFLMPQSPTFRHKGSDSRKSTVRFSSLPYNDRRSSIAPWSNSYYHHDEPMANRSELTFTTSRWRKEKFPLMLVNTSKKKADPNTVEVAPRKWNRAATADDGYYEPTAFSTEQEKILIVKKPNSLVTGMILCLQILFLSVAKLFQLRAPSTKSNDHPVSTTSDKKKAVIRDVSLPKRIPLSILILRALAPYILSSPRRERTNTLTIKTAVGAGARPPTSTLTTATTMMTMSPKEQKQVASQLMEEAQLLIANDPIIHHKLGAPLEIVGTERCVIPHSRLIRFHGDKSIPLELGFQVQGSKTKGIAIAMATVHHGIVKLNLHLEAGRVLPVSLSSKRQQLRRPTSDPNKIDISSVVPTIALPLSSKQKKDKDNRKRTVKIIRDVNDEIVEADISRV
jgi:hypothetical protein